MFFKKIDTVIMSIEYSYEPIQKCARIFYAKYTIFFYSNVYINASQVPYHNVKCKKTKSL